MRAHGETVVKAKRARPPRMLIAERLINVNGVELCTESFGDPADPPIVLVMGLGGSMLWWRDGFCRLLAGHGRFVIRYDLRDRTSGLHRSRSAHRCGRGARRLPPRCRAPGRRVSGRCARATPRAR